VSGTVNVEVPPAIWPIAVMVHVYPVTILSGVLVTTQAPASMEGLKPLPEIVTTLPSLATLGVSPILGENGFTVKPAEATSAAVLPVAVTV